MRHELLLQIGERVRHRREGLGYTQKQLAERAGLSLRFLAQLERGDGNISLLRFADVAVALGLHPAELLGGGAGTPPLADEARRGPVVALLGVRGAGKSTVGGLLAARLGVPFVELDERIEQAAGLALSEIFELHGEAYYRRLERETLRRVFAELPAAGAVLAAGGSIVNDRESFRLLRDHATTVWLRARPEDHWNRVIQQGDQRPMAENPHAFAELRALLAARAPLYAAADHAIDTMDASPSEIADSIRARVS